MTNIEEPSFEIIVQQNTPGVDPAEQASISTSYQPLWANMQIRMKAALAVTSDPKAAYRARQDLVPVRTGIDKLRLSLNEAAKKKTAAINGLAKALTYEIEEQESRLEKIEKAAEREEAARVEAIRAARMEALTGIITPETLIPPNLAIISDEQFDRFVAEQKDLAEIRAERARKEEAERIAKEQAEAAERERVRLENEALKAEAIAREAAVKAEREAAEAERKRIEAERQVERDAAAKALKEEQERAATVAAKEKAEREAAEARIKAEAAAQARAAHDLLLEAQRVAREAEEAAAKERQAREEKEATEKLAAEKALAAPDKERLIVLAATIRSVPVPKLTSRKAVPLIASIQEAIEALAIQVETAASKL